jgi:hypothetical protein
LQEIIKTCVWLENFFKVIKYHAETCKLC